MRVDSLRGRRVLVTGGAGFIGCELVAQLCRLGAQVTVLDNFSSGRIEYLKPPAGRVSSRGPKVEKADVRNGNDVRRLIRHQDLVYHLAALPFIPDSYYRPFDFFEVNVLGTLNVLLESAKSKSVERVVVVSSSEVYGSAQSVPMNEDHPTMPYSTYAVSKLAADRAAFTFHKENGLPVTVVRPFNSYGPNVTQPYVVPEIIHQILDGGRTITLGNTRTSRDFTFVSDTARGIVLSGLADGAVGETINLGSGIEITVRKLAHLIARLTAREGMSLVEDPHRYRQFDVVRLVCDNRKARRILGWEPKVDLEQGLRTTLAWFKIARVSYRGPFVRWYNSTKKVGSE